MEIRDVVHGAIELDNRELTVIDSRYFQRLRQIKQLGFGEFSFPSATHNRYIHSLGAMKTATRAFDTIFGPSHAPAPSAHPRWRAALRLAALLHDVGHGPLSHTTEFAMPNIRKLGIHPDQPDRKATHEDYTLKIILDSGLTPILERAGQSLGIKPRHIAALIEPEIDPGDDFFEERIDGKTIQFRPILHQLISSELDADRMDYLRRDSLHAGVSYGQYDFDWLVSNLTYHIKDSQCLLSLHHRALYAFEDFLISRFHMFLMVYFHYKSVVYDSMLGEYFASPDCDYALPADIEKYGECDDAHLYSHLAKSSNEWARRITEKRPYRMLIELHSGIPATRNSTVEQKRMLTQVQETLQTQNIHFLAATSTGELSKYFRKPGDAIYVRYDNHYSAPSWIHLEHCTDLFEKYREKRSITRLYVSPERYPDCRFQGRGSPMSFLDA